METQGGVRGAGTHSLVLICYYLDEHGKSLLQPGAEERKEQLDVWKQAAVVA